MTQKTTLSAAVDKIVEKLNGNIRVAAPLGLGKPNELLNLLFERAATDQSVKLTIFTALSLRPPNPSEDLAKRFLKPFADRHWGKNYPVFKYSDAAIADKLPSNIRVHEFYMQAGSALRSRHLQQNYQSINYTHVAEGVFESKVNLIVQMVAAKGDKLSLSCNPDLTLDVVDIYNSENCPLLKVAVIHPDLPYLKDEAEVEMSYFDIVVDSSESRHELFALPRSPISIEDHLIGFYASQLVKDDGTLQIGIGSLSDAIVNSLRLRHLDNSSYKAIQNLTSKIDLGESGTFEIGLYGLTEMLTDGFMHLRQAGLLKREVVDESTGKKTFLHGSFILGSKPFYQWLRKLSPEDEQGLRMTRVSKVNDLYVPNEVQLRRQRKNARFFNTTMQVTLLGEAMSETLPDGSVISGVGGQYNFVAMSHELKGSRSILMLRSKRINHDGKFVSNILWNPGHVTIPRHLRDIIVTEYGVADLRAKSDEECIKALLKICDSQFQGALLTKAKSAKKISAGYEIPAEFCSNTSRKLEALATKSEIKNAFVPFPFGSDFTPEEERIALALSKLQDEKKMSIWNVIKRAVSGADASHYESELVRMSLHDPISLKERIYRRVLTSYLEATKRT